MEARNRLGSWGGGELPPWPGVLPQAWMHPDLFFRLFGEEEFDAFTFQPALQGPLETAPNPWMTPYLVWVNKPFTNTWMGRISELWPSVLSSRGEGAEVHELRGLPGREGTMSEYCPGWTLSWQGRPLGEVRVFSRLCGEDLSKPAGVAVFDLAALARFGESEGPPPQWSAGMAAPDLFAWRPMVKKLPTDADFPLRLMQHQWEEGKDLLEAHLSGKRPFEAYLTGLDGLALLTGAAEWGLASAGFRAAAETALKPLLRKIPGILPRRSGGNKSSRDGVLR